ncbi:radical SAM protein [Pseudomonas chlororaphis]|uniref:Radical SAM protein n=1 Tax=Pseudomonas chlororaphis TaxID=587753 RepID=A0AB34C908_9PSED|nr:arsinothricin biosynthesis radical SAM protein ArsL [Pseudomonas chlororaphis]KAA5843597.1 radical SAM protein [Pseudomonas chlororaphis]
MKYLVASTFEGGYQPLNAISATTALLDADIDAQLIDIYVEGLCIERFGGADLVFICVPLFDSLTAGTQLAKTLKEAHPDQKICFFGQYATINAKSLAAKYGDYAIAGEWEKPIVNLAKHLNGEQEQDLRGVIDRPRGLSSEIVVPQLIRDGFRLPRRDLAPPLHKYPQPQLEKLLGRKAIVGGVEGSRGCHHKCSYCSVYAAYDGKVLLVSDDLVERDVANLVAQGMTHLTFTDADFFNAKTHGLKIIRKLHSLFPELTYDFTTRVDHILENKEAIKEMGQLGLAFITTALEFPKQEVLDQVFKEMDVPMIEEALAFLKEAGVKVNPTFITFNPWISLEDMAELHDFIARNQLENIIDPIQFETRLHLYKGSPLLDNASVKELKLEEHEFHFDWQHSDSRLDKLFMDSVTPPEEGVFKRCCLKC